MQVVCLSEQVGQFKQTIVAMCAVHFTSCRMKTAWVVHILKWTHGNLLGQMACRLQFLRRSQNCSFACCTGGVFGLFVALTGERMPGGAVAMAEGNALGKGPVIFHLFDSGIELIRRKAAGESHAWTAPSRPPPPAPCPPAPPHMHGCTHRWPRQATQMDRQSPQVGSSLSDTEHAAGCVLVCQYQKRDME